MPKQYTVSKILPFPKREIADPSICEKIWNLWGFKKKFIILSGPPGVGKTHTAEDFVYQNIEQQTTPHAQEDLKLSNLFPDFQQKIYTNDEIDDVIRSKKITFVWGFLVLHPQYTYEDLVRGYKVFSGDKGATLEVREGILAFLSRVIERIEAFDDAEGIKGILILDEINRAPIAQIFGEAIYGLDRRGVSVTTPYQLRDVGSDMIIPPSLLLIGTMNSIDRATAGFDFAMRRRFSNVLVKPSITAIQAVWSKLAAPYSGIGPKLFSVIQDLIAESHCLGTVPSEELVLGHAYFMPPSELLEDPEKSIQWLEYSYFYQILPTLQDYAEQGLIEFNKGYLQKVPFGDYLEGHRDLSHEDSITISKEFKGFFNVE